MFTMQDQLPHAVEGIYTSIHETCLITSIRHMATL